VCPYCDFAVVGVRALDPERERAFVESLLAELDLVAREHEGDLAGRPLATVYLGGGTPSLLRPESVERLLRAIERRFGAPRHEVTLELNPRDLEAARVPAFRAAGVTRLSVGLQSLSDRTLRRLGRAHRADEALRALDTCLEAGFASLSVDLIYAAPDQREADVAADVDAVVRLGIPHVSAYTLTIEQGTPFARAAARGQLRLADEDEVLAMMQLVRDRLGTAGCAQYEISNYARPGHESRHNERYWRCLDVLGLGPSAASLLAGRRFQNVADTGAWQRTIAEGWSSLAESSVLSPAEMRAEAMGLGLRRLRGVSRVEFAARFGAPPESFFAAELADLAALGLVAETEGHLHLTERGILFADEVFLRFLGG
jgi:oxygen-independent coproporphyrinogen-3 oxidase